MNNNDIIVIIVPFFLICNNQVKVNSDQYTPERMRISNNISFLKSKITLFLCSLTFAAIDPTFIHIEICSNANFQDYNFMWVNFDTTRWLSSFFHGYIIHGKPHENANLLVIEPHWKDWYLWSFKIFSLRLFNPQNQDWILSGKRLY